MLFARAERRDFQLPGGDGLIVAIAGGWAALLIFYRLLDKPGLTSSQRITATVGVEWGIFVALLLALAMLYAGTRMRTAQRPEPPLARRSEPSHARAGVREQAGIDDAHGELTTVVSAPPERHSTAPASEARRASRPDPGTGPPKRSDSRRRPRYPPPPAEQMSFEESQPDEEDRSGGKRSAE
jgi:hypothetical protein